MVMNNKNLNKKGKPRMKGQIGDSKITVIEKSYNWGIYVWKRANGKWFTDGNGNILNIPAMKGDIFALSEIKKAAAYYGEPDGEAVFFPGMGRVTDEEYSEQLDRMKSGLIPNLNDLGAVAAAKATIAKYGDEE
jgi:hypothetical protein